MASPPTAEPEGPASGGPIVPGGPVHGDVVLGRVRGVVLAGGRSRRFGRDKALEPVDGTAMAARVAAALRAGGAAEVVTVGGDAAGLAATGLVVWPDAHPGEGPLGGILTALAAPGADLVVIAACDLPWLDGATVAAVVAAAASRSDVDVAVARTGRLEPLLAAWRPAACRGPVADAFASGERAVHAALSRLRTVEVAVGTGPLRNVNHAGDLPR